MPIYSCKKDESIIERIVSHDHPFWLSIKFTWDTCEFGKKPCTWLHSKNWTVNYVSDKSAFSIHYHWGDQWELNKCFGSSMIMSVQKLYCFAPLNVSLHYHSRCSIRNDTFQLRFFREINFTDQWIFYVERVTSSFYGWNNCIYTVMSFVVNWFSNVDLEIEKTHPLYSWCRRKRRVWQRFGQKFQVNWGTF